MSDRETLTELNARIVKCTACPLHEQRKYAVPGEGPVPSQVMFIGEGPGFYENESGRPFVGRAGKLLADMLARIGLAREDVFITNVVKCRPPNNRDPEQSEIDACRGYLEQQIALINPRVIVTLGRFSMARYFADAKISQIHGQPKQVNNRLIVPMFHPAAALRQPRFMTMFEQDFLKLPTWIAQAEMLQVSPAPKPPADDGDAEQLSLF